VVRTTSVSLTVTPLTVICPTIPVASATVKVCPATEPLTGPLLPPDEPPHAAATSATARLPTRFMLAPPGTRIHVRHASPFTCLSASGLQVGEDLARMCRHVHI